MADSVAPQAAGAASQPTEPTPMASWSGRGVGIGQVDDALLELRRGEKRAATRISTINLVIVAQDDADAARARKAMLQLGGRNPGRTVIVMPDPRAAPYLDAQVHLYHAMVAACPVWWEEVQIKVGGPAGDHLDSLVEPLTLGDLPVTVWYASAIPDPGEPLVGAADIVVVESPPEPVDGGPTAGDAADGRVADVFSRLLEVAQRRPLIDLSWIRLTPWRRLLVTLFDAGDFRRFAGVVDRAEVAARPGSAMLLAGWLLDRLELPASSVVRRSASDAAITLAASGGVGVGRFSVAREEDDGMLMAVAEIEGGPRRQDAVTLPEDPLASALAEALTCVRHDRIYEMAIGAALGTHR